MEHLDEGTVHAWLDGALSPDEGTRVEAHVATCADCSALVAEARGLIAASSRILSALDEVPRIDVKRDETGIRLDAATRGAASSASPAVGTSARTTRVARRPFWTRVQFSAAAVAVLALGSLVVTRNRDRAIPALLQAPAAAPAPVSDAARAPTADSVILVAPTPGAAVDNMLKATRQARALETPRKDAPAAVNAVGAVAKRDVAEASAPREERSAATASSGGGASRSASSSEQGAARGAAAPARGATPRTLVTPPPVAPPVVAAKAVADSALTSTSARDAIATRKGAPAAPPPAAANVAADAASPPRAVINPADLAASEKKRLQGEPKLAIQAVVTTGSTSAVASTGGVRVEDVAGCWRLERSSAARAAGLPEQVELTARVVTTDRGRPIYVVRPFAPDARPDARSDAGSGAEWRWTIDATGAVSIVGGTDARGTSFPIAVTTARRTTETSAATRVDCVRR